MIQYMIHTRKAISEMSEKSQKINPENPLARFDPSQSHQQN